MRNKKKQKLKIDKDCSINLYKSYYQNVCRGGGGGQKVAPRPDKVKL